MAVAAEFAVLGAVEARLGGQPVPLGHARQQCVLVALLADINQIVPAERLADRVWGDRMPRRAANALHGYLSRLRRILAEAGAGEAGIGIARQRGGYMIIADPMSVDLQQFRTLLGRARASGDDTAAAALFAEALGLWRGEAFAGLDTPWLGSLRETLHQQRLAAELDHADLRLRLGQHAAILAELSSRARECPLDERVAGQLMLALHRSGRTADALAQYQATRRRLAADLGIDPGPDLQLLQQRILTADSALDLPVALAAGSKPGPAPARLLPPPPPLFTGRADELDQITAALDDLGRHAVIWIIDGPGGVGKTWLALRAAHGHLRSFPDGQLYANLRGFGPSGSAMDPVAVLLAFLVALGVPAEQIPDGLDAQASLYRSALAGRRMLVLLDNARDADQIRPLLPGSPGCLVLVTSRSQLAALLAAEGARSLSLGLLAEDEARELLASRIGTGRVAAEPGAVSEIIARCARLPLALAVAAARASVGADIPLGRLAGELRDAAGGLDAFATDDAATELRSVFSWSYGALSAPSARLFRQLGLHPGPDISVPAAASLAGLPPRRTRAMLTELARAQLLAEHQPGRYAFHDLLRAYAAERARADDSPDARAAAAGRMLDHYVHSAFRAAMELRPGRDPIDLAPPRPGVAPEDFAGHDGALAWYGDEQAVLLAAIEQAAAGFDSHVWQLGWAFTTFLLRRAMWPQQVAVQRAALDAARRAGSAVGQVHALDNLAMGYSRWGRLDEAASCYRQAADMYADLGDITGQVNAYIGLAEIAEEQGRPADALSNARLALDLYPAAGSQAGLAMALNAVGWCHAQLEDYQQALSYCQRAVAVLRELDDRYGLAATWDSIGYIHSGMGDEEQSATCYQHALDLYRALGDRFNEAGTLTNLGDVRHAAGDPDAARRAWAQALEILDELKHPDADRVRDKLAVTALPDDGAGAQSGQGANPPPCHEPDP